jgi:hypothetical protein
MSGNDPAVGRSADSLLFCHRVPGVALRFTPGFMLPPAPQVRDALTQIARTQAALKRLAKKTRSCRFAMQRIRTKQNYAGSGGIQKEAVAAGYYNPKLKCVGGLRDYAGGSTEDLRET